MVQLVEIAGPVEDRREPANASITDEEAETMARAVVRLFDRWGLNEAQACQLLGELPRRTYTRWKAGEIGRVGRDLKTRLSNLMGIHKALRIIFKEPERGYGWIKRPNEAFGGRSALDVMMQGELTDIVRVRRFLDATRG
jgi:uncharacterized protein (DUF2384 family)